MGEFFHALPHGMATLRHEHLACEPWKAVIGADQHGMPVEGGVLMILHCRIARSVGWVGASNTLQILRIRP
jgi:hypothetical protein